jgi:catechol 2,3-dioxygenase-like lactoylglutathione lyase family enzyme
VTVRGIEHVGITVPDIEEASRFLVEAFGAEVMYDMDAATPGSSGDGDGSEQAQLGVRPGVRWVSSRMLRLGEGPNVELFEFSDAEARPPATASDLGVQHLCLYVDDIDEARRRVIDAGGTALQGPSVLTGAEGGDGDGNRWLYTLTPWGSIVELITLPLPQAYEDLTPLRRWRPGQPTRSDA